MSTHRGTVRRWIIASALGLVLLVGAAILFLRVQFHGGQLADEIEDLLNSNMRGRVSIGTVDWPARSLPTVVTGGWVPVTVRDVRVWDAEGKQILQIERIDAELDVHALIFGNNDFVLRHVVFDGGWAILEEIPEPYPLHEYDTTVFSVLAAFYGERKPGYHLGATAGTAPVFDLRDLEVKNVDLTLLLDHRPELVDGVEVRRHGVVAQIENVSGKGFFYADGSDPLVPKLYFSLPQDHDAPLRADKALVTVEDEYTFDLHDLVVTRLAQVPEDWPDDPVAQDLDFALSATDPFGAKVDLTGRMIDLAHSAFGGTYDVVVTVTDAAGLARRIDSSMGGDDLTITLDVRGPVLFPRVGATLERLEYTVEISEGEPPLRLHLDQAKAEFDLATESGKLEETIGRVEQPGDDGVVELNATFSLSPYSARANVAITQPIEAAQWLPPTVSRLVGSRVHGSFTADGDSNFVLRVDDLDLHLGRIHIDRGALIAENELADITFRGLRLRADGTTARLDGEYHPGDETFALDLDLDSRDLDAWLRRAGVTPLASSVSGKVEAHGSLTDPRAAGTVRIGGIPVIADLTTTFAYGDLALEVSRGRSTTIGDISAAGRVAFDRTPRIERLRVVGRNVDLSKLPGAEGLATGRASLDVAASGPFDGVQLDATLSSDDATILGQRTDSVRACYNHDPSDPVCAGVAAVDPDKASACTDAARRGGQCLIAGVVRTDGGRATVIAGADADGRLDGRVALDSLPIDSLAQLAGSDRLPAGGTASVSLDLAGTLGAPTADGTMSMLRTWLFGAYLGDERFEVRVASSDDPAAECASDRPEPTTSTGLLALCGELRDGRIVVAAVLQTSGTMPVKARVDLRRIELDPFVDLQALLGAPAPVRAWTSGTITIDTELARAGAPLDVRVELPEIALLLERTDADGRPAPLVVASTSPLSARFDGTTIALGRPVSFRTPAGAITLDGKATGGALAFTLDADLDLGDVQPLIGSLFDDASGRARIVARVGGTVDTPAVDATAELEGIVLRPAGQDTELRVEYAKLDLNPAKGLSFGPLTIAITDRSSGEYAELTARGGMKLDGFRPVTWGVIVDGELAGKLLLALAPQALTQASGVAKLELTVSGEGADPTISGELTFDPRRPFAVMPRGLRREVILSRGRIEFTEDEIVFDAVSGSLDDEGRISKVVGVIDLEDFAPVAGDVTLSADGIPFRVPRTIDLVLSADDLRLVWGDDVDGDGVPDMDVAGAVEIVQGRYLQDLDVGEFLRPETSAGGATKPFWEEYPMLGAARLDVTIDARSLAVVNNIANIELAGEVTLQGTPQSPQLDGEIQVQRGQFKLPATRAQFTRMRGSVQFERFKRFPRESPTVLLVSEADYRDSTGQDHLITLTLEGPLSLLNWDLTTSSGLNKSQTISLLLSGRAPEEARRGASLLDSDPTRIDPTTNPTQGAADQFLKDFAGDFISLLVADPLKDIDFLDVARVEVGTGSVSFYGEKDLGSAARVVGGAEQTIRGRTLNLRLEVKSTIGLSVQFGGLSKDFDDPAEEDITDYETKLVYRWFLP